MLCTILGLIIRDRVGLRIHCSRSEVYEERHTDTDYVALLISYGVRRA